VSGVRGPKKREIPYERISNIAVPRETYAQVRLLLLDPVTKKVKWGAMSQLVTRLLQDWVDKQRVTAVTTVPHTFLKESPEE
jgi:hypothetical protein